MNDFEIAYRKAQIKREFELEGDNANSGNSNARRMRFKLFLSLRENGVSFENARKIVYS